MKSRKKRLREVYVWELPVRIYHWLNALCIVILCITGFIIADPPAIMTETEANFSYWFGRCALSISWRRSCSSSILSSVCIGGLSGTGMRAGITSSH